MVFDFKTNFYGKMLNICSLESYQFLESSKIVILNPLLIPYVSSKLINFCLEIVEFEFAALFEIVFQNLKVMHYFKKEQLIKSFLFWDKVPTIM